MRADMPPLPSICTQAQVAAYFGLDAGVMDRILRWQMIPHSRLDGQLYFKKNEVECWWERFDQYQKAAIRLLGVADMGRLLTMDEATTLYGIHRTTLRQCAKVGLIPSYRFQDQQLFLESDVILFAADNAVNDTETPQQPNPRKEELRQWHNQINHIVPLEPPFTGYVYVLNLAPYYKIGHAKNVPIRMRELQVALPEPLILTHTIRAIDPELAEDYFHYTFESVRVRGEWFRLTETDLEWLTRLTDFEEYGVVK